MRKSLKTKRSLIQACLTMCLFIFLKELYSLQQWNVPNYYSIEEDIVFPSTQDVKFSPKANSIFFHVTSFQGYMKPSEACAVEAAARAHPKKEVYVLFTSPITDNILKRTMKLVLKKLRLFPNIKLFQIHLPEYSNGTVVESLLQNGLKNSSFLKQHTADVLKILTLNKWGGLAIDTNMIVLRSLRDFPPNWILKENEKYVVSGIMGFSKNEFGFNVTSAILKEMSEIYDPNLDVTNLIAIEKVVQRICPVKIRWESCEDIVIYPSDEFYSVDNVLWTSPRKVSLSQVSFSFHLDVLTNSVHPLTSRNVLEKYCPSIFLEFQDNLMI